MHELYPRPVPGCVVGRTQGQFEGGCNTTCVCLCASAFPAFGPSNTGTREPSSMEFQDKALTCIDCGGEFIFTAGEQLFFHDKQFKNEPKRCKTCKSKRAGVGLRAGTGPAAAGLSRTETRTECSACGIGTTV